MQRLLSAVLRNYDRLTNIDQVGIFMTSRCVLPRLFIKRRIHIVDILLIKLLLGKPQAFAEFSNLSKCSAALYLQGLQGDFILVTMKLAVGIFLV